MKCMIMDHDDAKPCVLHFLAFDDTENEMPLSALEQLDHSSVAQAILYNYRQNRGLDQSSIIKLAIM